MQLCGLGSAITGGRGSQARCSSHKARHQYIGQGLTRHPKAMAMPVEADPFFSKTVARIYIWIVDGAENLKLELMREGLLPGDNLMTILQFDDLYITAKQLWAFRKQVAAAESSPPPLAILPFGD